MGKEMLIHIKTDFASVFLLNGAFAENADGFSYGDGEPLYVTVLPLSAHLLPYTVKIAANKPLTNEKLCACFSTDGRLFVKLYPRYNYIYSPHKKDGAAETSAPERLFNLVKQKSYAAARKLLSDDLSRSVDDAGLDAFFADYTAMIKDDYGKPAESKNGYYLITAEGKGTLFRFETADGLIDNIVEG